MGGLVITVQQAPSEWTVAGAAAAAAGAAAAPSAAATGFPVLPFPPQPPSTAARQVAETLGTPGTPGRVLGGHQRGDEATGPDLKEEVKVEECEEVALSDSEEEDAAPSTRCWPRRSSTASTGKGQIDRDATRQAEAPEGEEDSAGDEAWMPAPHPPPPEAPGGPLDPRRMRAVPAHLAAAPWRSALPCRGRSRSARRAERTRRGSGSPRERLSRQLVARLRAWARFTSPRRDNGLSPITVSAVRVSDMLGVSPRFLREASEIYGCRNDAAPRWIMEHGKVTVFPRRGEWGGYRGPRWHHR